MNGYNEPDDAWLNIDTSVLGQAFAEFELQLSPSLEDITPTDLDDAFDKFLFVKPDRPQGGAEDVPPATAPQQEHVPVWSVLQHASIHPSWVLLGISFFVIALVIFIRLPSGMFSGTLPSSVSSERIATDELAESGDRLAARGKWAEALIEHAEAARLDPDNAKWHAAVGKDLSWLSRWEEAENEYHQAVRLEPRNAQWRNEHGNSLIFLNRWKEALMEHKEAVRLEPNNARWHNSLGVDLRWMNRLAEAEAEYKEALRLDPQNLTYQNNLKSLEYDTRPWHLIN